MYLWKLIGHHTSEAMLSDGVGEDLPEIMRRIEEDLAKGSGLVARVCEVVPCVSVFQLSVIHVPTGREWHARRDRRGGVHWEQQFHPVDPGVAFSLDGGWFSGDLAS